MSDPDDLYVPDGEAEDDDPAVVAGMEHLAVVRAALKAAEGSVVEVRFGG